MEVDTKKLSLSHTVFLENPMGVEGRSAITTLKSPVALKKAFFLSLLAFRMS